MKRRATVLVVCALLLAVTQMVPCQVITNIEAEAVNGLCRGQSPQPRLLCTDAASRLVPPGYEPGLIVLHIHTSEGVLKGPELASFLSGKSLEVDVSKLGSPDSSTVEWQYSEPGVGLVGHEPGPNGAKDEIAFDMGDAILKTEVALGERIAVTATISTDDANHQKLYTSATQYVKRFYTFEFYRGPIEGLPGFHLSAFNTYSYSPSTNQASADPIMLAWGLKIHTSDSFYVGLSLSGFYTITPNADDPARSNLSQICLGCPMIDLNNLLSIAPGANLDFSGGWPPRTSFTLLLGVDSGVLDALKH